MNRHSTTDVRRFQIMKHGVALLLMLLVCGCTRTLTKAGLDSKAAEVAGLTPPGQVYYVGSNDSYDYFTIRGGQGGKARLYSVPRSERAVTTRFIVSSDETSWLTYPRPSAADTNIQAITPE